MLHTFIKSRAATFTIAAAAALVLEGSFFMMIEMFAIHHHQLDLQSFIKVFNPHN